jgi:phage terminase large subunit
MTVITLPHNFTPRPYQEEFFSAMNKGCKRAVLVWHRRAGKDTSSWNFLIYTAYEKKGVYYYVFPTFAQGRKVLWDSMTMEGIKFLDFIPKILIANVNNQEMKVKLKNGSIIQIVGSDNYDAIMGTNPSGCIFSEYSMQDPNAWQYIRPILDANKGWAIFVFTPRGANHAKDLFDMASNNPDWFCQKLTVDDTKIMSKEDLDKIRLEGTSEDMIQQEWYCSFTQGIVGSYYAQYMQEARDDGRIGKVPHDTQTVVHTAWDLGVGDSTCIIWFQLIGKEIHCINYYEASGEGLPHYAKILKDKPYLYGTHYAPHDIEARELSHGLSRREVASSLGIRYTVLPTLKLSKEEAIECVRGRFNRCWIDAEKCKRLILCLENYRKIWNDKMQCYHEKPVHDWSSHGADAFSYMMHAVKLSVDNQAIGISDSEADRMMDRFQPRFD